MPPSNPDQPKSPPLGPDAGRTRAAVVDCIRRRVDTVEAIAAALALTDNAVRFHLTTLEDAGVIRRAGVVRRGGVGKPPTVFELTEAAEETHSRAYAAVLAACIEELGERVPPDELRAIVESVGVRLAADLEKPAGALATRIHGAVDVLEALGGVVTVSNTPHGTLVAGASCPLATAVAREPVTCGAVRALLGELIGEQVTEACEHSDRPRCRFLVPRADAA